MAEQKREAQIVTESVSPPLAAGGAALPPQKGVGVWLRRYRRALPIPFVLLTVLGLRPAAPWGSNFLDGLTDVIGVGLCALGQWLRLWAWGSNATVVPAATHGIPAGLMGMKYPRYVAQTTEIAAIDAGLITIPAPHPYRYAHSGPYASRR